MNGWKSRDWLVLKICGVKPKDFISLILVPFASWNEPPCADPHVQGGVGVGG